MPTKKDGSGASKVPERPIFDNLYNLKYRWDPSKYKNANYDNFISEIRKCPGIPDPQKLGMDEFNNNISLIENDFTDELNNFENLKMKGKQGEVYNELELLEIIKDEKQRVDQEQKETLRLYNQKMIFASKVYTLLGQAAKEKG